MFKGGKDIDDMLSNAIVLQRGSDADISGYLSNVLRHEYKHKNLPWVPGEQKNYGYINYPGSEGMNYFLSGYSPEQRGEEQAAETFAGRTMPDFIRSRIMRDIFYGR